MGRKKKVKDEIENVTVTAESLPLDIEAIKKWSAEQGQIVELTFYPHLDRWMIASRAYEHYTSGSGVSLKEAWDRFHELAQTRAP